MRLTISPYDLTHRAPGALGALLIADGAATIVPIGRAWQPGDPELAASESPALGRLLDSWRWTIPLWSAGMLGPTDAGGRAGVSLVSEAAEAMERSIDHPLLARLSAKARMPDRDKLAENLGMDILRGGRDPSLSVPVASALERFAAETTWPLVICPTNSVVGGIELRMTRPIAGLDCPAPIGASGESLLALRARLSPELDGVRSALGEAIHIARAGGPPGEAHEVERAAMVPAGDALHRACAQLVEHRGRVNAREWVMVRFTVAVLPPNAMARAAEIAAGHMVGAPASPDKAVVERAEGAMDRPGALALLVRQLPWDLVPSGSGR